MAEVLLVVEVVKMPPVAPEMRFCSLLVAVSFTQSVYFLLVTQLLMLNVH